MLVGVPRDGSPCFPSLFSPSSSPHLPSRPVDLVPFFFPLYILFSLFSVSLHVSSSSFPFHLRLYSSPPLLVPSLPLPLRVTSCFPLPAPQPLPFPCPYIRPLCLPLHAPHPHPFPCPYVRPLASLCMSLTPSLPLPLRVTPRLPLYASPPFPFPRPYIWPHPPSTCPSALVSLGAQGQFHNFPAVFFNRAASDLSGHALFPGHHYKES